MFKRVLSNLLVALHQLEHNLYTLLPPKWYVELKPSLLLTNVYLTC